MDIKEIKHYLKLMDAYGLCEFTLEKGDCKVSLKRPVNPGNTVAVLPAASPSSVCELAEDAELPEGAQALAAVPAAPAAAPAPQAAASAPAAPAAEKLLTISSPMVGTFYAGTSPDSPPLAYEGLAVGEDTTVAVIESMKIMSEIKAECRGVIAKVCVSNGQPVEFGQPLFLVRPE